MNKPLTLTEARDLLQSIEAVFHIEKVTLEEAIGRVLAEPLKADRDYPPFNRAAMDGFAIKSEYFSPGKKFYIKEEIYAGTLSGVSLQENECVRIMTGAPVPLSCDAIVRVEDSMFDEREVSFALSEIRQWQHIARKGEDVTANSTALNTGVLLESGEIAIAASLGYSELNVYCQPKVAIITTGNEIVPVENTPQVQQIRNSNTWTLTALLKGMAIKPVLRVHVSDEKEQLLFQLKTALEQADVVLVSGGVSAGKSDFVPEVLSALGVDKLFHKVQIKPGKPIWVGKHPSGKMVFALPGNPVSVQVCFKLFVTPWLCKIQGLMSLPSETRMLSGTRKKKSELDEFIMVIQEDARPGYVALKPINGSGDITATAGIYGIIRHPSELSELTDGAVVEFCKL